MQLLLIVELKFQVIIEVFSYFNIIPNESLKRIHMIINRISSFIGLAIYASNINMMGWGLNSVAKSRTAK